MKNIHVLPTEKFSNLILQTNGELRLSELEIRGQVGNGFTQHIYITSDEEIKTGDYVLEIKGNSIFTIQIQPNTDLSKYKKIILTTDQDLIKDGVQAIDDEFLEWFVKNPSCERVDIESQEKSIPMIQPDGDVLLHKYKRYQIIIPKGTLEKTAVEWLIHQIFYTADVKLNRELFNQAKEMEKKQIIRAFDDGLYSWDNEDDDIGIDYYNKKFKNK